MSHNDKPLENEKNELASILKKIIESKNTTQTEIANLLRIDQPKISRLLNSKSASFSFQKMFRFFNTLGYDIFIDIRKSDKPKGKISITQIK